VPGHHPKGVIIAKYLIAWLLGVPAVTLVLFWPVF